MEIFHVQGGYRRGSACGRDQLKNLLEAHHYYKEHIWRIVEDLPPLEEQINIQFT
jgi:hypothetical protein